jgi:hypothetical protein
LNIYFVAVSCCFLLLYFIEGLLTLCNIVADYFLLNFTEKRKIFQKVKELDMSEKKNWTQNSTDENCDNLKDQTKNYEDIEIII